MQYLCERWIITAWSEQATPRSAISLFPEAPHGFVQVGCGEPECSFLHHLPLGLVEVQAELGAVAELVWQEGFEHWFLHLPAPRVPITGSPHVLPSCLHLQLTVPLLRSLWWGWERLGRDLPFPSLGSGKGSRGPGRALGKSDAHAVRDTWGLRFCFLWEMQRLGFPKCKCK